MYFNLFHSQIWFEYQPKTILPHCEHLYCKHFIHITQSNMQLFYMTWSTWNNWISIITGTCSEWFVPAAKSCRRWNLFCFCAPEIIFSLITKFQKLLYKIHQYKYKIQNTKYLRGTCFVSVHQQSSFLWYLSILYQMKIAIIVLCFKTCSVSVQKQSCFVSKFSFLRPSPLIR